MLSCQSGRTENCPCRRAGGQITHEYLRLTAAEKESDAVRLLVNVGSDVVSELFYRKTAVGGQKRERSGAE